jgi:tetratricopeptide (TPR) repeat protein
MVKKKSVAKRVSKAAAKPATALPRLQLEQTMRDISRLIEEKQFEDVSEINAYLATLGEGGLSSIAPEHDLSASEQAQDLVYEAMEATTRAQARKLMKRALAKDPNCVDALVALAGLDAASPKEAIARLQRAVTAGERSLGARFFKENKGYFWGVLETRPYMRALQALAQMFEEAGLPQDAIAQYERMLELNPNDNQGVREPLLGLYLQTGNSSGTRALMKRYEKDSSAVFAWGRVLERLLAGELEEAVKSLKAARKANPFIEFYLIAQREPPKDMPEVYALGSEEEALCSLESVVPAWTAHPEALFWLLNQILAGQSQSRPPRTTSRRKKDTVQ